MQNLRDKLLKAGMVSSEEVSKAEADAQKPRVNRAPPPASRPSRPPLVSVRREARPPREAPIPKLPPLPGSPEFQRLASKKQRELDQKLRELVLNHPVAPESGTHTFHFVTRKGRLRRMELSEAQARLLEEGKLAVVERPDPDKIEHALVAPEVAEQMQALSPRAVRFFNKEGAPVGFLSEEELKDRQDAEKAEAEPEAPKPSPGETWIAVKRADTPPES